MFRRHMLTAALTLAVLTTLNADEKPAVKPTPAQPATRAIQLIPAQGGQAIPAVPVVPSKNPKILEVSTHEQIATVKLRSKDNKFGLQTLCADGEGNILGLIAPPRTFGAAMKNAVSEVHVLSSEGKPVTQWEVTFHAQAINVGPDGTVYVAGDGKVARFDKSGKAKGNVQELPQIADLMKNNDALKDKAQKQLEAQERSREMMAKNLENFKKQKADLEKKKKEELTKTEERQLQQLPLIIKSYEQSMQFYAKKTIDDVIAEMTGRMRVINGIAASTKDLFVVCGEMQGYGYAIWRLDLELKNPKQVLSGIGGCCGQMDIQCHGSDIVLAENTKHSFARYDRDGKPLDRFGKRGVDSEPGCFGGCCNPMNVRTTSAGDILTAESEGIIKRFSAKGDFLGIVGAVELTGGCKNVAVAANKDASRVYFCDLPGSRVIILGKKSSKPASGGTE